MERKDFFKTCAAGICSCGVIGMLAQVAVADDQPADSATTTPSETDQLKYQLDGAQERFAHLLTAMETRLSQTDFDNVLQDLGGKCSEKYAPFFEKYRGNLQGFLEAIKTAWVERTEFDEKTGILRIISKPSPCACPLVKAGRTPARFCTCSLGWNRAAFSVVMNKPVTVELEESVLGGGTRCTFRIKV